MKVIIFVLTFFFFQAEDGIRVRTVTGVQTCALPICERGALPGPELLVRVGEDRLQEHRAARRVDRVVDEAERAHDGVRSEERRGGKESRSRLSQNYIILIVLSFGCLFRYNRMVLI